MKEANEKRKKKMEEIMQRSRARTPRRRFGIYACFVMLLAIAILCMGFWLLFYIQKIEVKGNVYSDQEEVVAWMIDDEWSYNSVYTLIKWRFLECELPKNIEKISVVMMNPWSLVVNVTDKEPVGGIAVDDYYMYCDAYGLVILQTDTLLEDIPLINGMEISDATLYEELEVGDVDIFSSVLEVMKIVEVQGLTPDEISYQSEDGEGVILIYGEITVLLGTENFDERIAQVEPMLQELIGEAGVLHLENYTDTNTRSSFVRKN